MFTIYILPILYAALFAGLAFYLPWLRRQGVKPAFSALFSLAKMATGVCYTYIMIRYVPAAKADIDLFFGDGLAMYQAFWQSPADFPNYLRQMFTITDFNIGSTQSDFVRTAFDGIKIIHFLLNFFSGGQVYTNIILFNGLAALLFLRAWVYLYRATQQWATGLLLWVYPGSFFFTSVILKEGIEWVLLALLIPVLCKVSAKKASLWWPLQVAALFLLMFFYKYLIAVTLAACLTAALLISRLGRWRPFILAGLVAVALLVFFGAKWVHPKLNLPAYIVERRLEFEKLEANSSWQMQPLEPGWQSFGKALPEAVRHVAFSPLPGEGGKSIYLIFSFEILLFWALVAVSFFSNRPPLPRGHISALGWAVLLFSLANLLIIGYSITNVGAVIRYRSIFLPLLLWPVWQYRGVPNWLPMNWFFRPGTTNSL
ncbi:MAG: hypothetical protein MUF24_05575 [Chitinophagaceae bacterium]|nr:hypothetical protein [Chitinophagaceae bacterium]